MTIQNIQTKDARFPIGSGAGSDAIHRDPIYSYAATLLQDDSVLTGTGLAFTLGEGNDLVCQAAAFVAQSLKGREIEELMADFGTWQREVSNEQQFRWLGPHKGVVQLALDSVTNACWDLWAKKRGLPLWQLLLDLSPEALVASLDLSYLEDVEFGQQPKDLNLYWIEEPTHPDDIVGHATLAKAYGDTLVAVGEHVPNRIIFKNYFQSGALGVCQVDAVRVAGVSEFLAVSLMAKKFGIPVVPHVGDMGQIHQHLVLFNHIGMAHKALMLEQIPHLKSKSSTPVLLKTASIAFPGKPACPATSSKLYYPNL